MATYYVDVAGDDGTGDGSSGNPWATLAHAIDNSIIDDTIIMNAGTHTWVSDEIEQRTIQGIQAGVGESNTTILDAGGAAPIWSLDGAPNTFNDITFRNNYATIANSNIFYFKAASRSATFTRCVFHDIEQSGGAANLDGGMFGLNGTGQNLSNCHWTFLSCNFYDLRKAATASAAQLFGGHQQVVTPPSGSITMTHCSFDVSGTGTAQWSRIITYAGAKYDPITLTNCIFNNRSGTTFNFDDSNGAYLSDGIYFNNCCYNDIDVIGVTLTDSINDDPLFIDPQNGDFRLQQNSPCIDAGTII
jgi:hypothetical protein